MSSVAIHDSGSLATAPQRSDISSSSMVKEGGGSGALPKPAFPALGDAGLSAAADESRSIRVPAHRYTPLKEAWDSIVGPIVEHMKLMIRMNARTRSVEIKTSAYTTDSGALQRAEDFVRAFLLGFEVRDALALLRMEDLFVESFEVTDVKPLKGDHLSRAIGRIAGQVRLLAKLEQAHSIRKFIYLPPPLLPHPAHYPRVVKRNMRSRMRLASASSLQIPRSTSLGLSLTSRSLAMPFVH